MEETKQTKDIHKKEIDEDTFRHKKTSAFQRLRWIAPLFGLFILADMFYEGEVHKVFYNWHTYFFMILLLWSFPNFKAYLDKEELTEEERQQAIGPFSSFRHLITFAISLIGVISYFILSTDIPGTKVIYWNRTEMLWPAADLPKEYLIEQYRNGDFYAGMSKEYTYGSGRGRHTERQKEGFGYKKWKSSGDYYMGNWKEGERTCGLYVWGESGAAYFGDFAWNEDSSRYDITGRGIYCYSGGHSFDGHFKNGNREGWGYYYYHDGRRLYAEFKDNERIAYKELARKDCYVGWFKEREYTGYGRYYYAEGGFYQGWFKNGMFNGPGKVADAQNQIVADRRWKMADPEDVRARFLVKPADGTGNISDLPDSILVNTKYGPRLITFSRKDMLQRPKRSEDINAEDAFLTQPDPSARRIVRYKGRLVNKKPEGTAEATFENGDVYIGGWHNGLREGYGEIRYTNGEEYKGEWKADKRTGKGYYFKGPNDYVKGDFVDGHPHGLAIRYVNGVRIFNGRWENGQPTKKGIKANARGKTP